MQKFGTVMLIDDNANDNFLHACVLRQADAANEILEFIYADDALAYLKNAGRSQIDAIFLDINLPRMNGWEFLDAYGELYEELRKGTLLVMVSGTIDPEDVRRAEAHPLIDTFVSKPITTAALEQLALEFTPR